MNFDEIIKKEICVKESSLEKELLEQGTKYAKWAQKLAECRAKYDQKKLELQILEAQLAKKYRETLTKVTERAVDEAVTSDERWIQMNRELLKIKEELTQLEVIVNALIHRKDMLTNYVNLIKVKSFKGGQD